MNLTAPNGTSPAVFLQAGCTIPGDALDIIDRARKIRARKIKEARSRGITGITYEHNLE